MGLEESGRFEHHGLIRRNELRSVAAPLSGMQSCEMAYSSRAHCPTRMSAQEDLMIEAKLDFYPFDL